MLGQCENLCKNVTFSIFIFQLVDAFKKNPQNQTIILSQVTYLFCWWLQGQSQGQSWSLIHWGRVTHICIGKLTSIGSDNGLAPGQRQAIIWANAGILLIGPSGTNFSAVLIEIYTFPFKKIHLKISSGKWRLFCLSLLSYDFQLLICLPLTWYLLNY